MFGLRAPRCALMLEAATAEAVTPAALSKKFRLVGFEWLTFNQSMSFIN